MNSKDLRSRIKVELGNIALSLLIVKHNPSCLDAHWGITCANDFFVCVWLLLDRGALGDHGGEHLDVLHCDSGVQCTMHQLQPPLRPILGHAAANERPCFLPGLHFNHSCSTAAKVI